MGVPFIPVTSCRQMQHAAVVFGTLFLTSKWRRQGALRLQSSPPKMFCRSVPMRSIMVKVVYCQRFKTIFKHSSTFNPLHAKGEDRACMVRKITTIFQRGFKLAFDNATTLSLEKFRPDLSDAMMDGVCDVDPHQSLSTIYFTRHSTFQTAYEKCLRNFSG